MVLAHATLYLKKRVPAICGCVRDLSRSMTDVNTSVCIHEAEQILSMRTIMSVSWNVLPVLG